MRKKIVGNPTTPPYPRADWNQTDETKADYIKNKPVIRYPYIAVNMSDIFSVLQFATNTVTHVYGGPTETGMLTLQLHGDSGEYETEETVLILDLSSLTTTPTIRFNDGIKWLNGEPPEIAAGKVYMFSFVLAKGTISNASFYLGIGGEFA